MPRLEQWEIKKYWKIFQGLAPQKNKLSREQVAPVLKNSRLPDDQLAQIWQLADIDADGHLDFEEFCISMRMIFDLVNGDVATVPAHLPSWLVPSSKAHLIQANDAVAANSNTAGASSASAESDDEDTLSDDFDWYISPTDKATYEAIYTSSSDRYGRVAFTALQGLYDTLRHVPALDVSSAWNLVNPKSAETIDKDQVLVLLHMLNQRENGRRMPRSVPASLRATFSRETPSYDLSVEAPRPANEPSANDRKSFGTNYLNKMGQAPAPSHGTDFSTTEGTDWEEVRLRRELADLETRLSQTRQVAAGDADALAGERALERHEFEQLLRHKQAALTGAKQLEGSEKTLADVRTDVSLIASQVQSLQEFLGEKERELSGLRSQLGSA